MELLYGLDAGRSQWETRMEIAVLHELTATGEGAVVSDLTRGAEEAFAARGTVSTRALRWRRRRYLQAVAQNAQAQLVHETEALGTPFTTSVPRLVTCHDLIPLRYPRHYLPTPLAYPLRWSQARWGYERATRVIAISEQTKGDLVNVLHLSTEKIEVIPSGITLPTAQGDAEDAALRASWKAGERPYALYVGYGDYRKNVPGMFAALKRARMSLDLELLWAGELDAPRLTSLQFQAQAAGVGAAVRFLGFVPDDTLHALYRGAVAHLFLSRLEGFGLSVVEAMALGCPVIVARGSGTDELVGNVGTVVDADDAQSAADALVRLGRDPAERQRQGEQGMLQAPKYTRTTMAQRYVECYGRLLTEKC